MALQDSRDVNYAGTFDLKANYAEAADAAEAEAIVDTNASA
jgi:hypothetical protein